MPLTSDYYFAPQSPWTYLGHARLTDLAAQFKAQVNVLPVDLGGKVFPISGGLPLGARAPQRQAYRLVELERFSQFLSQPLHIKPKYFPVAGDDAARLIVAVRQHDGDAAAMKITGAVLSAVWAQERNIADPAVLAELLHEQHLDAARLAQAATAPVQSAYENYTNQALEAGVFGAPAYVLKGELFWGQDRLEFLQRRLQSA